VAASGARPPRHGRYASPALPVAFLTGRSGDEHTGQAIEAGAVDFIDKTCGIDVLVQKLGRLVRPD
jgi:DNA-binding response OmpR family regulator